MSFKRTVFRLLAGVGIDPSQTASSLRAVPAYMRARRTLKEQAARSRQQFPFGPAYPCLSDYFADSGMAKGHYFHQDLLVARRIFEVGPERHVDVGSRVDGFVAHVAAFRPIEVLDIRPMSSVVTNIEFIQADLMGELDAELHGYCDSLSCLHALEHFGLGRYGDPVDYDGHLRGLDNLYAMLRPGGKLYLSVPIGPQRIEFNAHRVFSVGYMLEHLAEKYRLDRFSYVDNQGDLHEDVEIGEAEVKRNFSCTYGCGIFEATKL